MNAITPPNPMRRTTGPRQRDVSDRADEAHDGDQRPDHRVLDQAHGSRGFGYEQGVEEAVGELADEPREKEPDRDLLHSIDQSLRKLCATSDHARALVTLSRTLMLSPAL